jgi:hypothetical protein
MRRRARFVLALAAIVAVTPACSHAPPDATPESALRSWLDHMDAQTTDPREAKAAYALLGPTTRQNLDRRAERASQIEGHHVEPYEVLAEGRFALRFRPKRFTTTLEGQAAVVEVTGAAPTDTARMRCVKEGKGWRVELTLPELPEAPKRSEDINR